MRTISRVGIALAALALLAPALRVRGDEIVRTLRVELPRGAGRFSVENLVGTMQIREAPVATVTAIATIYAESQSLADAVRFETIEGARGETTLRVRYPYERIGTFRYLGPSDQSDGFWERFTSSSAYSYDGHRVRVNRGRGSTLFADVEVQVPEGEINARFSQLVGSIEAESLRGRLRFEVASADLRLERLDGTLELEGSSGDIRARDIKGNWKSDFSSGDLRMDGFEGDSLELHASSGDFSIRQAKARRIVTETNSGDVRFLDADVEDFTAEATSGDIVLEDQGGRLKNVDISTSSGDVSVRLPWEASFEATARQSSGDMRVGFPDGDATRKGDSLVGYRRGDHGAKIRVRTSSGDLSIEPI